jgi:nucleoid DNA-binding protein
MAGRENLRVEANKILKAAGHATLPNEALQAVFEALIGMLKSGDRVQIQEFGTFFRKIQAPRKSRNPKTGETLHIPGKIKMGFSSTIQPFEATEAETVQIKKLADAQEAFAKTQVAAPAAKPPAAKPAVKK